MSDCKMCGAHNQYHITYFGCVQYWKHRTIKLEIVMKDIRKHINLCHDSSDSNLDSFYKLEGEMN